MPTKCLRVFGCRCPSRAGLSCRCGRSRRSSRCRTRPWSAFRASRRAARADFAVAVDRRARFRIELDRRLARLERDRAEMRRARLASTMSLFFALPTVFLPSFSQCRPIRLSQPFGAFSRSTRCARQVSICCVYGGRFRSSTLADISWTPATLAASSRLSFEHGVSLEVCRREFGRSTGDRCSAAAQEQTVELRQCRVAPRSGGHGCIGRNARSLPSRATARSFRAGSGAGARAPSRDRPSSKPDSDSTARSPS